MSKSKPFIMLVHDIDDWTPEKMEARRLELDRQGKNSPEFIASLAREMLLKNRLSKNIKKGRK